MNQKVANGLSEDLFDESASGYEIEIGNRLTPGLSAQERRQASILYHIFNELWGLCIIRGEPGAGKDTFLNWFLFTIKRWFPNKRILRDERPRKLFGSYDGLFNEEVLRDDLQRMREFAKGVQKGNRESAMVSYMNALEVAADDWVGSDGAKVLLQNSVLGLTEFWDYVYNRTPQKPINKTMGGIHKMKRHLNILIMGCVQLESDLDKKTCKPFIDWRVTCVRSIKDSTQYVFLLEKVKYDRMRDLLYPVSQAYSIPIDAGKPRSFIGDGKIIIRNHNYIPQSEEEQIILDCIKSGMDTFEGLVDYLKSEDCMYEAEILGILKDLCLKLPKRRPKFAVWYPCYYFIFNSRSAPQLRTSIRIAD